VNRVEQFIHNRTISSSSASQEFKQITEKFAELARRRGFEVVPYNQDGPRHFQRLEPAQQIVILQTFKRYYDFCAQISNWGLAPKEDRQYLWRMIKRLGVRPSSDLFAELEDGDIIEIYDCVGFVQIFRNFRFYTVCSYSLDDVLCRPWFELYERDDAVTEKISATVMDAVASGKSDLIFYDVGEHRMDEIDSDRKYHCIVENRFIAPLLDDHDTVVALVNVVRPVSIARG